MKKDELWQFLTGKLGDDMSKVIRSHAEGKTKSELTSELLNEALKSLLPFAAKRSGCPLSEFSQPENGVSFYAADSEAELTTIGRIRFSDKSFRIEINEPLVALFIHIADIWVTRIGAADDDGVIVEDTEFEVDETARATRSLLEQFFANRLHQESPVDLLKLTHSQLLFASRLVGGTECFLIGHELGHFVQGKAPLAFSEIRQWSGRMSRKFVETLAHRHNELFRSSKLDSVCQDWAEEFAADLIGLRLVYDATSDEIKRFQMAIGVCLFFLTLDLVERFYWVRFGRDYPVGSHPYSRFRLAVIRAQLKTNSSLNEFANFFESAADEISNRIGLGDPRIALNRIVAMF
jgi:hypothetical protein